MVVSLSTVVLVILAGVSPLLITPYQTGMFPPSVKYQADSVMIFKLLPIFVVWAASVNMCKFEIFSWK